MKKESTKILQIEDDLAAVYLIREFLSQDNPSEFEITHASRLSDGLAVLAVNKVDVILLDLNLPDSSGFNTFERVKAQSENVPIVVMSSFDEDEFAIRILHAGAQEYLVKGEITGPYLKRVIRYAIGTQRLQRELDERTQELQTSEEIFRDLIAKLADGIVIVDGNGWLRFLNPAAEALFERRAEDLIGEPFGFPVATGKTTELEILTSTGKTRTAEMQVVDVVWEGQKAHLASLRDVTERKTDENALRANEERLRMLIEQLPIGVSLLDQNRKMVFANQALIKILEMTSSDDFSEGKFRNRRYIRPDGTPMPFNEYASVRAFTEQQPVKDIETGLVTENGKTIWTNVSAAPSPLAEKGVVVATMDITKRKQMELELQHLNLHLEERVAERTKELNLAQEKLALQEKLAILGQLAGSLAHELRTPLATIKNAAYFFKMVCPPQDSDYSEMLKVLNNAVMDSDRIISSVLRFARPQISSIHPVLLAGILRNALAQTVVPQNISIQIEIDEELSVLADSNYIEIALSNLIRNAVQSMPDGGSLRIKAEVRNGVGETPAQTSICIQDTGGGILPENMDRLFEPLYSTKIKGIGLGLPISKLMVEAHDGRIDVTSVAGHGSSFTIVLPGAVTLAETTRNFILSR